MGKMDTVILMDEEKKLRNNINNLKAEKLALQTDIRARMHKMTAVGGQLVKQRAKLEKIRKAKRQAAIHIKREEER